MILIETVIIHLNSTPGLVGYGTSSSYPTWDDPPQTPDSVMFPTSLHAELSKSHCPRSFISGFPIPPGMSLSPWQPHSQVCVLREQTFPHLGWTHYPLPCLPRDHTWLIKLPRPSENQATLSTSSQDPIPPSYCRQCQQAQEPALTVPSGGHCWPTERQNVNSGTYTHCPDHHVI